MHIPATPANVVRGVIPCDAVPIAEVEPGQPVSLDTLSHQGLNTSEEPAAFFAKAGIAPHAVLAEALSVYREVPPPPGMGVHVLTGPLHIAGAQPGDLLEVRVLDVRCRVPYGVNASRPGAGVLPDLLPAPVSHIIHFDMARGVALFAPGIEVPLAPFMGIMAVAPSTATGTVSSRPPGAFGGNLDLKQLTRGATLYLPVFQPGALFFTGDGHACQGDGEVDVNAIETSLMPTFQFYVHKGKANQLNWPRAETATHYISMGIDRDLNLAMKAAVREVVNFLMQEKNLSASDAYQLASIAVDFRVAEAVNFNQAIYGMIPKNVFKQQTPYWFQP
ncbi:MAG: amidase [Betaproteobacteria bacterium]|nr:amidase [Betaproteobacteria bacterium]